MNDDERETYRRAIAELSQQVHQRNLTIKRLRSLLEGAEFRAGALQTMVDVGSMDLGGRICLN